MAAQNHDASHTSTNPDSTVPSHLCALPAEVLLRILSLLDVRDLLAVSRTSKVLRTLATDPLLHRYRLRVATLSLSHALTMRPDRVELLSRRRPLISLTSAALAPSAYIYSPIAVQQVQAYLSVRRLMAAHRLKRGIDQRPTSAKSLSDVGLLDSELGAGRRDARAVSFLLVPAMRALKRAQKADALRQSMRRLGTSTTSFKTAADVLGVSRGVWRDNDQRVILATVSVFSGQRMQ